MIITRAIKYTFWFLIVGGLLLGLAKQADAKEAGYYATVRSVTPNHVYVSTPVRDCRIEQVQVPIDRPRSGLSADGVVGAIVGGVIGNQFGGGDGKTAMTALGAVIGNNMATAGKPEYKVINQEVCTVVDKKSLQVIDYTVTLEYNGVYWNVTMKKSPAVGQQVRVRGLDID